VQPSARAQESLFASFASLVASSAPDNMGKEETTTSRGASQEDAGTPLQKFVQPFFPPLKTLSKLFSSPR